MSVEMHNAIITNISNSTTITQRPKTATVRTDFQFKTTLDKTPNKAYKQKY